jgi:hypothetical protein
MANIQYTIYKKIAIEKCLHNGFYIANTSKGYLKADTLKGIKNLINENKSICYGV